MRETLNVQLRSSLGKKNNRRLRRSGQVPAVLYGHGQDSVSLSIATTAIEARCGTIAGWSIWPARRMKVH